MTVKIVFNRPLGAYYTGGDMVATLVGDVLAPLVSDLNEEGILALRVLDPACGDGAFLLGVAEHLTHTILGCRGHRDVEARAAPSSLKKRVAACLAGVDIDGAAVEAARLNLKKHGFPMGQECLFQSDTLDEVTGVRLEALLGGSRGGFDAVLGNPPYVDAVQMAAEIPGQRARYQRRYRAAHGAWDLYCVFIERALELTRRGGRHGFIVPSALLGAEYARGARACLLDAGGLTRVRDTRHVRGFDAHVYPIGYSMTVGGEPSTSVEIIGASTTQAPSPTDAGPWPLLDRPSAPLVDAADNHPPLSALAEICGGATVAEAYALRPLLEDRPTPGDGELPVINSGTIDPFRDLWGIKPMRYLGDRWQSPVVEGARLAEVAPRRHAHALAAKVVLAGLGRRLEAVACPARRPRLAAKSTVVVLPGPSVSVGYLTGLLNSPALSGLYRARYGSLAMRGGYMRVGPPQLRPLPIPDPTGRKEAVEVEALAHALAESPEDPTLWSALEETVCALYA